MRNQCNWWGSKKVGVVGFVAFPSFSLLKVTNMKSVIVKDETIWGNS